MSSVDFSTTVVQIRAAKDGDQHALNELLARYLPRVRMAVMIRTGHMPKTSIDVDDLVQEVLINAIRNLDTFEARTEGGFTHWLMTIAINKIRDARRHEGRKKRGRGAVRPLADLAATTSGGAAVPSGRTTPSEAAKANELDEARHRALLKLPPRYRNIIVDHDLLGFTHEEIAQKLGFETANPARALYNRAARKLRKLLEPFDTRGADLN
jgi:RNA polymerase sigma-70 factor (ECF subfamily)